MDYTSTPITTTFPAGATSIVIDIPVTVDDIVEESEMFDLNFTISSSLNDRIIPGSITKATAVITDDTGKMSYINDYLSAYTLIRVIRY